MLVLVLVVVVVLVRVFGRSEEGGVTEDDEEEEEEEDEMAASRRVSSLLDTAWSSMPVTRACMTCIMYSRVASFKRTVVEGFTWCSPSVQNALLECRVIGRAVLDGMLYPKRA